MGSEVAIYDGSTSWWSGIQVAATNLFSAIAAAGLAWLAMRRKVSQDNTDIALDKSKLDFTSLMLVERKEAIQTARESIDKRLEDAGTIAGQAALIASYKERLEHCEAASIKAEGKAAEAEERARALTDELLSAHIWSNEVLAELIRADAEGAQEFLRTNPKPTSKPRTSAGPL